MKDKLQAKIAELQEQRDTLVREANQQIAFLNGQIAALQALVDEQQTNEELGQTKQDK